MQTEKIIEILFDILFTSLVIALTQVAIDDGYHKCIENPYNHQHGVLDDCQRMSTRQNTKLVTQALDGETCITFSLVILGDVGIFYLDSCAETDTIY